jgi:hypothetical protein
LIALNGKVFATNAIPIWAVTLFTTFPYMHAIFHSLSLPIYLSVFQYTSLYTNFLSVFLHQHPHSILFFSHIERNFKYVNISSQLMNDTRRFWEIGMIINVKCTFIHSMRTERRAYCVSVGVCVYIFISSSGVNSFFLTQLK